MGPSAEWVQSVFSCSFESRGTWFIAPNRDYSYEGLLVHQGEEHWKLIDCVGLALRSERAGDSVLLEPDGEDGVRLTPWCATYAYRARVSDRDGRRVGELPLEVSYYLCSETSPRFITGCVELHCPRGLSVAGVKVTATLQPFFDIRHMYHDAGAEQVALDQQDLGGQTSVRVLHARRALTFHLPPGALNRFDTPATVEWEYKLGSGGRVERPDSVAGSSTTAFEGRRGRITAFFNCEMAAIAAGVVARLHWCSTLPEDVAAVTVAGVTQGFERSRQTDEERYRQIGAMCPIGGGDELRVAIQARVAGLTKLKSYVEHAEDGLNAQVPPAGCWWFRTPWFRDIFEGILSSLSVFTRLPGEKDTIKRSVLLALAGFDAESGRIPNKIWEYRDRGGAYNSADASLLCFITAATYFRITGDVGFARRVLPFAAITVTRFGNSEAGRRCSLDAGAPPRADPETGLLMSVPAHSWIDTTVAQFQRGSLSFSGLPNRVSAGFVQQCFEHIAEPARLGEVLAAPNFYLPEINALWIVMLEGVLEMLGHPGLGSSLGDDAHRSMGGVQDQVARLLARARRSFRRMFWNEEKGFLYNCVLFDGEVRDPIEAEPAVVAAALLAGTVLSGDDVASIWDCTRRQLLVSRRSSVFGRRAPLSFGIATKNDRPAPFYGDGEYHGNVVWPRSTPYLIRLLEAVGARDVIRDILLSNLDHQMGEGAVFYNHELFSRPVGNNSSPVRETEGNPVPVKNPIQFWSQWCDAFIEYLDATARTHRAAACLRLPSCRLLRAVSRPTAPRRRPGRRSRRRCRCRRR